MAGSVEMLLGMQAVPRSIPASGTFVREEQLLVMAKECTLSTGEVTPGGLSRSRNGTVRITARPDMTSALYCDVKQKIKTNREQQRR